MNPDTGLLTVAAAFGGETQCAAAPLVLVLPAMGVAASFYERFGASLAAAVGGTVYLIELPGQGCSQMRARRGDDFGYADVVDHGLPTLVEAAARRHPGRPLFLVGHSLGGQLALLSLEHVGAKVAGLVLIASGSAHWSAWPRRLRWRARALVLGVALAARLLPWYPGARLGFGGNQSRRWMRDWSHNARRGGYRLHAADGEGTRVPDLRGVTTPVLALTIQDDPVAPAEAGQALLSLAPDVPLHKQSMRGVLADAPWKRHFSWARQPAEAVRHSAAWIRERLPMAPAANDDNSGSRRRA